MAKKTITHDRMLPNFQEIYGPGISSWEHTYKKSSIDWDKKDAELRFSLEFPAPINPPYGTITIQVSTRSSTPCMKSKITVIFVYIIN